jgi:hypothetical protein
MGCGKLAESPPEIPDGAAQGALDASGAVALDARGVGDADRGAFDAGTFLCLGTPPEAATRCQTKGDCAIVRVGCACGFLPAYGVNRASFAQVEACEEERTRLCPIDCTGNSGYRAQDGRTTVDAGALDVDCVFPSGPPDFAGACTTVVR